VKEGSVKRDHLVMQPNLAVGAHFKNSQHFSLVYYFIIPTEKKRRILETPAAARVTMSIQINSWRQQ
jgi:hypothetical protein